MVDAIIRITTLLVVLVALMNVGHAALLAARLARAIAGRHGRGPLTLWLPAWWSPREARAWVRAWREVLSARDPVMSAIRLDGRAVMLRHAQLFAWSETWAMLVVLIAP
jgi:hypothetical protein